MRRMTVLGLLAVASLASAAADARADIIIQVPFVTIRIGRNGSRHLLIAPCQSSMPVSLPAADPQGTPLAPIPIAPPADPVPPVAPPGGTGRPSAPTIPVSIPDPRPTVRALTLGEFASSFRPVPGPHEVVLVHPVTGAPVKVAFTLPPGSPRKVRVLRRQLDFVYPRHNVAIRFPRDGSVRVRN
jgi:hypothetical protein